MRPHFYERQFATDSGLINNACLPSIFPQSVSSVFPVTRAHSVNSDLGAKVSKGQGRSSEDGSEVGSEKSSRLRSVKSSDALTTASSRVSALQDADGDAENPDKVAVNRSRATRRVNFAAKDRVRRGAVGGGLGKRKTSLSSESSLSLSGIEDCLQLR